MISAQVASLAYATGTAHSLFGRSQCPGNTSPCPTSLGAIFSDICCQNGQLCAFDANNNAACCPSGAVCTGTAPATAPNVNPTAATSYVPNSYFSFPYAPTSFANSASCASATNACSNNYDVCLTNLGGTGYRVTVNVPQGGGTTVNGDNRNLGTSARAICSSLSSQACSNLEATKCDSISHSAATTLQPRRHLFVNSVSGMVLIFLLFAGKLPTC